jgi:hypothetical protein
MLQQISADAPVLKIEQEDRSWIEDPFPLIFASSTIKAEPISSESSEYPFKGRLQLGQELDIVFTDKEHVETVKQFLSKQGVEAQVYPFLSFIIPMARQ